MPKYEIRESGTPFEGQRQKFATQMDADLLRQLREYAKSEGRQIQSVLEEAVEALLREKDKLRPSPDIMTRAEAIMDKYSDALEYLAK